MDIRIRPEAMEALSGHSWQGNVRELSNVLERALLAMHGEEIEVTDLPFVPSQSRPLREAADIQPIRAAQADAERAAVLAALRKTGNNKSQAANLLGIHRTLLYKKMKKHGIVL